MKYRLLCIIIAFQLSSCITVKPSERIYLNDSEMQLGNTSVKNHENYVYSIREAATPAGGIKSSGGCGCN